MVESLPPMLARYRMQVSRAEFPRKTQPPIQAQPRPPTRPSQEDPKTQAHKAVDAFRTASGAQAWPKLDRAQIAAGLDQRIDNPSLINQGPLNVCGSAAIVYMLASHDPLRFVNIVQQVFEQGSASLGSETLTAGTDLRNNTPPANMEQVDWVLLSSMRDSENAIFDYEGNPSEDASAISTPGDLQHWMKSVLKCKDVDWQSAYVSGEMDVIRAAGAAAGAGKNVTLLIDAAMMKNLPKEGKIGSPNHWVVMKSDITEATDEHQNQKVQFSVWTWGQSPEVLNLDKSVFIKTFYGAICTM